MTPEEFRQAGTVFISPSQLNGRWMVRVSIGVEATTGQHLEMLWELIQQQLRQSDR